MISSSRYNILCLLTMDIFIALSQAKAQDMTTFNRRFENANKEIKEYLIPLINNRWDYFRNYNLPIQGNSDILSLNFWPIKTYRFDLDSNDLFNTGVGFNSLLRVDNGITLFWGIRNDSLMLAVFSSIQNGKWGNARGYGCYQPPMNAAINKLLQKKTNIFQINISVSSDNDSDAKDYLVYRDSKNLFCILSDGSISPLINELIQLKSHILLGRAMKKEMKALASGVVKRDTVFVNDTCLITLIDTMRNRASIDLGYNADPRMFNYFKPHFISNLCTPYDDRSALYIQYLRMGNQYKKRAMNNYYSLKNNSTAKDIRLQLIPVYFLTPNLVEYKLGDTITKYYSLDTTNFTYIVWDKNKPTGIISYQSRKDSTGYKMITRADSSSLRLLCKLVSPSRIMLFNNCINISGRFAPGLHQFGYLNEGGRVIFPLSFIGQKQLLGSKYMAQQKGNYVIREDMVQTAETYFAFRTFLLTKIIDETYQEMAASANNIQ